MSRNVPIWELLVYTPAVFVRMANKGVAGYGTWKKIRKMGDGKVGTSEGRNVQTSGEWARKAERTGSAGLTGLAEVRSRNHDSCYHKLLYVSTTILVQFQKNQGICSKDFAKRRKQRGRVRWEPGDL